jgi:hypothetical protein
MAHRRARPDSKYVELIERHLFSDLFSVDRRRVGIDFHVPVVGPSGIGRRKPPRVPQAVCFGVEQDSSNNKRVFDNVEDLDELTLLVTC